MTPYSDMKEIGGQRLYMLCYHMLNLITFVCPWFRVVFSKFIGIHKCIVDVVSGEEYRFVVGDGTFVEECHYLHSPRNIQECGGLV